MIDGGPVRGHRPTSTASRARRHHHLRAHAADQAARAGHDLHREDRRRHRRSTCARASWSSWNPPPTPARPARSCCRSWRSRGLKAGKDFFLAFSPEREDPGRKDYTTQTIPKVVGGLRRGQPQGRPSRSTAWPSTTVVPVSSCEVAEAAKILENIYRCVNIALVNELKMLFDRMGIDVWEVIAAAEHQAVRLQAVLSRARAWAGTASRSTRSTCPGRPAQYGLTTRFIELAGEINIACPRYVVSRLMDALNDRGKRVKGSQGARAGPGLQEGHRRLRESPSLELIELLKQHGAKVDYNDPHVPAHATRCASTT